MIRFGNKFKLTIFSILALWFTLVTSSIFPQDWHVVRRGIGRNISEFGFSQLHFPDSNNGWAVSFQDPWGETVEVSLIYTKDGGLTWNERLLRNEELIGIDYKPRAVYFINAKEGWLGGVNNLGHTTDGGESWQVIEVGYEGKPVVNEKGGMRGVDLFINSIYFANPDSGWVAGHGMILDNWHGPFILYTNDGGKKWEAQIKVSDIYKDAGFITSDFIHPGEGWAGGWEGEGFGNGIRGVVMHIQNGGNWQALTDLPDGILHICFADSQNGWAVTYASRSLFYIYNTMDGGHTWIDRSLPDLALQRLQKDLLLAIDFANAQEGWAVGGNGVIIHTRDAGKHWILEESHVDVRLVDVQYVPGNGVFALGNDGTILKMNLEVPSTLTVRGKLPTTWARLKIGQTSHNSAITQEQDRKY